MVCESPGARVGRTSEDVGKMLVQEEYHGQSTGSSRSAPSLAPVPLLDFTPLYSIITATIHLVKQSCLLHTVYQARRNSWPSRPESNQAALGHQASLGTSLRMIGIPLPGTNMGVAQAKSTVMYPKNTLFCQGLVKPGFLGRGGSTGPFGRFDGEYGRREKRGNPGDLSPNPARHLVYDTQLLLWTCLAHG